ncbi:MAG: DUF1501 domain-containing protein [Bacteroidota bacterium]
MWSRRAFLKAGGLAMFSAGVGGVPRFISRTALASSGGMAGGKRRVLVAIFQRGAMDGLMAVSPLEEPLLRQYRPHLMMEPAPRAGGEGLIPLDALYGMHPGLSSLLPLYREGHLAIVHGVGSPDTTRSHFDAQDYMETGTPGRKGTGSGWLNRATRMLPGEATPFRAVAMTSSLPRSLYGEEPALAIADLPSFGFTGGRRSKGGSLLLRGFQSLYEDTVDPLLRKAGGESFEAARLLSGSNRESYRPAAGANYPETRFGKSLRQIAQLIKSDVGLEVAFAEMGGWDTHVQQGASTGPFARLSGELAGGISAFWADLQDERERVLLMTMTEFGRTVRENGSGGTDHGRASCLFLLGQGVKGGAVHGGLPPLMESELEEGRDLPVRVDFRSVFGEVAARHLGLADASELFPGWKGVRMDLLRA